jgi:glyoxylase-like metal-dependent hydrolase (beta-lactamase superfamily II)
VEIYKDTFVISTEFWGRQLNLFLLRGDTLFLIDTGLAGMPQDLIFPYMEQHDLPLQALTLMTSTHAHADHMGGNAEIKAACPQAQLGAHELDRPWIEDHELLCRELYRRHADMNLFGPEAEQNMLEVCGPNSPVDVAWNGTETIELGDRRIEVIHAPGHTPGNLVFLDREAGILFEAETILGDSSGEPGKRGVPYYYDVAEYRNTLQHLAELSWDTLLSSHADPRDREAGLELIRHSLSFVDHFHEHVLAALSAHEGPVPFDQLAQTINERSGYDVDLALALLIDTHLEYLERTKQATQLPDGRWSI